MAPKKPPAAAVASKFGTVQSREIQSNPQFARNRPLAGLPACHLIPVKTKDAWIDKMTTTFGQTKQFWDKHQGDAASGIALPVNIHSAFDASAGIKVAFLPDLDRKGAKKWNVKSKEFLVLHKPVPGSDLSIQDLFAESSVKDIQKKSKGFVVQFHGGVQLLINLPVPERFKSVSSFFLKKEKGKIDNVVSKLSEIAVVERALRKELLDYKDSSKLKKKNRIAAEALSAMGEDPRSIRMVLCFDEDLPFYTVRGLQARSLRLLEHEGFKDLPNGKHFSGDDISEESTEEDRSPADAQMDLLLRACRDGATLSGLSVEQSLEPCKKRQKNARPLAWSKSVWRATLPTLSFYVGAFLITPIIPKCHSLKFRSDTKPLLKI